LAQVPGNLFKLVVAVRLSFHARRLSAEIKKSQAKASSISEKREEAVFGHAREWLLVTFSTAAAFFGVILAIITFVGGKVSSDEIVVATGIATAVAALWTLLFAYTITRRGNGEDENKSEPELRETEPGNFKGEDRET
jgi:hypothetical protein